MSLTFQVVFTAILVCLILLRLWLGKRINMPKVLAEMRQESRRLEDYIELNKEYCALLERLTALLSKGKDELDHGFDNPATNADLKSTALQILKMDAQLAELDPNHVRDEIVQVAMDLVDRPDLFRKQPTRH